MTFPLPRGCSTPELCGRTTVRARKPLRLVDRKGVEPLNGVAELIYSQRPLATWIPVRECYLMRPRNFTRRQRCSISCFYLSVKDSVQSRRRGLNSRPSAYKADALPLSYVGVYPA